MWGIKKADRAGNFGNRTIGLRKHMCPLLESVLNQPGLWAASKRMLEKPIQIGAFNANICCNILNADIIRIIHFHVSKRLRNKLFARGKGCLHPAMLLYQSAHTQKEISLHIISACCAGGAGLTHQTKPCSHIFIVLIGKMQFVRPQSGRIEQ